MAQIHWTSPVSADFSTAADWSSGTVPGAGDDAILDAAGSAFTVTSNVDETVGGIQTASNATLDITGGNFTASAGTGVNAGTIIVGEATLTVGGTFNNAGTINLDNSDIQEVQVAVDGSLINQAGGIIDATGVGRASVFTPIAGDVIINDGTLEGTGAGGLEFDGATITGSGRIFAGAG